MAILSIVDSKCKKDGICAMECPAAIIKLMDDTGFPGMIPGKEKACIRCGHCVAVCPYGALSHKYIPIENCPPIKPELNINEEQAVQFVRSRRSIRAYKKKPVERTKIVKLIELARYAPTGGNSQKVEWLVLTDKNKLNDIAGMTVEFLRRNIMEKPKILVLHPYLQTIVKAWDAGFDPILWNAPALVVASAHKKILTGMVDLSIALSYLDLLAPTLGLGTCWAGLLCDAISHSNSLKEYVGVPIDHPHLFPLLFGYPKTTYYRLPGRKPPKITFY